MRLHVCNFKKLWFQGAVQQILSQVNKVASHNCLYYWNDFMKLDISNTLAVTKREPGIASIVTDWLLLSHGLHSDHLYRSHSERLELRNF